MLGLWLGGGVNEGSELLVWVRRGDAILAASSRKSWCSRPRAGERAGLVRYAAVAAGFAAFLVTRRSTLAGVVCGELVMLAGNGGSADNVWQLKAHPGMS